MNKQTEIGHTITTHTHMQVLRGECPRPTSTQARAQSNEAIKRTSMVAFVWSTSTLRLRRSRSLRAARIASVFSLRRQTDTCRDRITHPESTEVRSRKRKTETITSRTVGRTRRVKKNIGKGKGKGKEGGGKRERRRKGGQAARTESSGSAHSPPSRAVPAAAH